MPYIDIPSDAFCLLKTGLAARGGVGGIANVVEDLRLGQACAGIRVGAGPSLSGRRF